jgi:hypothetical protein
MTTREPDGRESRPTGMTTEPAADGHVAAGPRGAAFVSGAAAGLVTVLVIRVGLLYFDSIYGPFDDHAAVWGPPAGLGCGVVAAATAYVGARWVARRSRLGLVVLVATVCAGAWVLWPHQVDVGESWVPVPNARWDCTGWSIEHYPPGTMDGSTTDYCVGLEKRIADG